MTKIVIDHVKPPIKQIYILWWCGNMMGWSENKDDLHEWAKSFDATWEGDEGEGTTYVIMTSEPGFDPVTMEEVFDILIQ